MNDPARHERVMDLFDAVCDLPPDRQIALVREQCNGDDSLRDEVLKLLRHDARPIGFVAEKAHGGGFEMIAAELAGTNGAAIPEHVGSYRIIDKIGEGGMGIVYRAEQQRPKRTVALKVIRHVRSDASLLRRFEHEAELLARLSHPGIAQVYEAGMADLGQGLQPFIAMELVQGLNLLDFVGQRGLNVRQKLELVARVCDAVQHAHQRGVIHRDLKPANILVVEGDATEHSSQSVFGSPKSSSAARSSLNDHPASGGPQLDSSSGDESRTNTTQRSQPVSAMSASQFPLPKILDFGVARAADIDVAGTMHTTAGQIIGTLAYMSPEQVRGDAAAVDTRTDVYALGVVLYQILSSQLPLPVSGKPMAEAARIIRDDLPRPLGEFETALRGDIETIVAKALEKDRERRYASASELAADLRRHLNDEPILARPATRLYAMRKFAARNKALVGAGALVAILFSAAFYLVCQAWLEADVQRDAAILASEDAQRSRDNEVEQRDLAERKARLAETVIEFISNDVLAQASPRLQPKRDIMLREVLDRASGLISQRFAEEPEAEAYMQYMMGATYESLGELDKGEEFLRRSLELRRQSLGESDPLTLNAHVHLAATLISKSRYDEAETLLKDAIRIANQAHGGTHDSTIRAMKFLAMLHRMRGRVDDAEPIYNQLLEALKTIHGEAHAEVIAMLNALSDLKVQRGRVSEGLPLAVKSMTLAEQVHGPSHQRTIEITSHAAMMHRLNGDHQQAIVLARKAYETAMASLGPDHNVTIDTGGSLALAYAQVGQLDEAERLLRDGLAAAERSRGLDHKETLTARDDLASCLIRQQRYSDALPLLRQVYEGRCKLIGEDHVDTLFTMDSLAQAMFETGQKREAIAIEEHSLEIQRRVLDESHPLRLLTHSKLGSYYVESGEVSQAEAAHGESLRLHRKYRPPDFLGTAEALVQHAECLGLMQDYERAEEQMLEAFEIFQKGGEAGLHGSQRAAASLATLYGLMKKSDEEAHWRRRLTELTGASSP